MSHGFQHGFQGAGDSFSKDTSKLRQSLLSQQPEQSFGEGDQFGGLKRAQKIGRPSDFRSFFNQLRGLRGRFGGLLGGFTGGRGNLPGLPSFSPAGLNPGLFTPQFNGLPIQRLGSPLFGQGVSSQTQFGGGLAQAISGGGTRIAR